MLTSRMPLLSKASNVVQNVFFLYDVTGFTQKWHSIPVATNCTSDCIEYRRHDADDMCDLTEIPQIVMKVVPVRTFYRLCVAKACPLVDFGLGF